MQIFAFCQLPSFSLPAEGAVLGAQMGVICPEFPFPGLHPAFPYKALRSYRACCLGGVLGGALRTGLLSALSRPSLDASGRTWGHVPYWLPPYV